ncbi:MAG: hypothetical protein KGH69_03540 [Candidatus Micrarchaeota archaeon]|nr:hypothetical protein [Candidatus Micrarchaeota archaeon]
MEDELMGTREISRSGPLLKNGEMEAAKKALGISDAREIESRIAAMQDGSAVSPQGGMVRSIRRYESALRAGKIDKARRKREARQDKGTRDALEVAIKNLGLALEHASDRSRANGYEETINMLNGSLAKLDRKAKARVNEAKLQREELEGIKAEVKERFFGNTDTSGITEAAANARRNGAGERPIGKDMLRQ